MGVPPKIIHFNGIFPYKPSILGYPHLWKPPYHKIACDSWAPYQNLYTPYQYCQTNPQCRMDVMGMFPATMATTRIGHYLGYDCWVHPGCFFWDNHLEWLTSQLQMVRDVASDHGTVRLFASTCVPRRVHICARFRCFKSLWNSY